MRSGVRVGSVCGRVGWEPARADARLPPETGGSQFLGGRAPQDHRARAAVRMVAFMIVCVASGRSDGVGVQLDVRGCRRSRRRGLCSSVKDRWRRGGPAGGNSGPRECQDQGHGADHGPPRSEGHGSAWPSGMGHADALPARSCGRSRSIARASTVPAARGATLCRQRVQPLSTESPALGRQVHSGTESRLRGARTPRPSVSGTAPTLVPRRRSDRKRPAHRAARGHLPDGIEPSR